MKLHRNAALSWRGRRRLARRVVVEGWTLKAAAEAASVSVRCARKWVGRYRLEGELGLGDRSSAPQRVANRTPVERVEAIVKLRRLRFTAAEIAETLAMPPSTVSGILTRRGLGRLGRLGLEPPVRDERSHPGELLHVDVKKLGRIERGANTGATANGSTTPTLPVVCVAGLAGSTSTSPSTTTAVSPTPRCSPTRKRPPRSASFAAPPPSTAAMGSTSSACSRTTAAPPLKRARAQLPCARYPPPPQPTLPTTDQWQSRTLHPHPPQRLGLRRHLPNKQRTHQRT
jgi:transposase